MFLTFAISLWFFFLEYSSLSLNYPSVLEYCLLSHWALSILIIDVLNSRADNSSICAMSLLCLFRLWFCSPFGFPFNTFFLKTGSGISGNKNLGNEAFSVGFNCSVGEQGCIRRLWCAWASSSLPFPPSSSPLQLPLGFPNTSSLNRVRISRLFHLQCLAIILEPGWW